MWLQGDTGLGACRIPAVGRSVLHVYRPVASVEGIPSCAAQRSFHWLGRGQGQG